MARVRGEALTRALAGEIKQRRLALGLSQEELAEKADIHRTFVGLIESGKRGLSVAAAAGIADALETSLSQLIAAAEQSSKD